MKTFFPIKTLTIAAAFLLIGGVAQAAEDYVTNAGDIVKAADWKQMETIVIELDEHSYEPKALTLKANQPYKLELKNVGEKKHYFTAPEFFKAVATRKVQSNKDGEIKAPYFLALEMMANGGQLDFYFVTVNKGSFPFYCTIEDHREKGMNGTITVE